MKTKYTTSTSTSTSTTKTTNHRRSSIIIQQKLNEFNHASQRLLYHEVYLFCHQQQQQSYCNNKKYIITSNKIMKNDNQSCSVHSSTSTTNNATTNTNATIINTTTSSSTKKRPRTSSESTQQHSNTNTTTTTTNNNSTNNTTNTNNDKTWTEIIQSISTFIPYMTNQEYQIVCKLILHCLLSYIVIIIPTRMNNNHNHNDNNDTIINSSSLLLDEMFHNIPSLKDILHTIQRQQQQQQRQQQQLEQQQQQQQHSKHLSSITQYDSLHNDKVILSFWNFLYNGLKVFLSSKSINVISSFCDDDDDDDDNDGDWVTCCGGSEDLLHLLAMAISPELLYNPSSSTSSSSTSTTTSNQLSNKMKYFISIKDILLYNFQLSYLQRSYIVHVLSQSLILNDIIPTNTTTTTTATNTTTKNNGLSDGIIHLRVAIQTFYVTYASSAHHLMDAKRLLCNIAIDTRCDVLNEFKTLLQRLAINNNVNNNYHNNNHNNDDCCHTTSTNNKFGMKYDSHNKCHSQRYILSFPTISKTTFISQQQWEKYNIEKEHLCIHCSTGSMMKDYINRYNGARQFADNEFMKLALVELTNCIAIVLGTMKQSNEISTSEGRLPQSCCSVVALLDSATALLYFVIDRSIENNDDDEEDDGDNKMNDDQILQSGMKETLFEYSIQLLRSQNECIVKAASKLLAVGFSYSSKKTLHKFIANIYQAVQSQFKCIVNHWKYFALQDIIKVSSRLSMSFANSILATLIDLISSQIVEDEKEKDQTFAIMASIAQMQPKAMWSTLSKLMKACKNGDALSSTCKAHLISIVFMCRQAFILPSDEWSIYEENITTLLQSISDGWSLYLLTRQAFCTGNFGIAAKSTIETSLLNKMSSSSKSYLWFMTLFNIASAESSLSKDGSLAIPSALTLIDSAINTLKSLATISSCSTIFQYQLLCQRKDFLQLCLTARGLCAEMRLINSEGCSNTRTRAHKKNISKCFYMLASQYFNLYRNYGAIQCQQTRTSIRSMFALCSFLGDSSRKIFCESPNNLHQLHHERSSQWPNGDLNNIQCSILINLRDDLLKNFDKSVEPHIRAESMMEIIDVICRCPFPYPRGLFSFKSISPIDIMYSVQRSDNSCSLNATDFQSGMIEIKPFSRFVVFLNGTLPEAFVKQTTLSFSQLVAYTTMVCDGFLSNKDTIGAVDEQSDVAPDEMSQEHIGYSCDLQPVCEHINVNGEIVIGSKFSISIPCKPFFKEGHYYMETNLFLRDIRGGEYCIPINEDCQGVIISCSSLHS